MNKPSEILEVCRNSGKAKANLNKGVMFVLAFLAGMYIAFGALGSQIVSYGLASPALSRLLSAVVFPVGLMLVVICGAELFTGNVLMTVSCLYNDITVPQLLAAWFIVYAGNFAGSFAAAFLAVHGHVFSMYNEGLAVAAVAAAKAKVAAPFSVLFFKGIMCNILVCLAVWASFSASETGGKIAALYLPVFLFVLGGYEHCVANMYFIPAGIMAANAYRLDSSTLSYYTMFTVNLIPVTLGNIAGGVFVSLLYFVSYRKR